MYVSSNPLIDNMRKVWFLFCFSDEIKETQKDMLKFVQSLANSSPLREWFWSCYILYYCHLFTQWLTASLRNGTRPRLSLSCCHSSWHSPFKHRREVPTEWWSQWYHHILNSQDYSHPLAEEKDSLIIIVTEFNWKQNLPRNSEFSDWFWG